MADTSPTPSADSTSAFAPPASAGRSLPAENPTRRCLALAYALHAAIHLSPCSQREVRDLGLLSADLVRELHALAAAERH